MAEKSGFRPPLSPKTQHLSTLQRFFLVAFLDGVYKNLYLYTIIEKKHLLTLKFISL